MQHKTKNNITGNIECLRFCKFFFCNHKISFKTHNVVFGNVDIINKEKIRKSFEVIVPFMTSYQVHE